MSYKNRYENPRGRFCEGRKILAVDTNSVPDNEIMTTELKAVKIYGSKGAEYGKLISATIVSGNDTADDVSLAIFNSDVGSLAGTMNAAFDIDDGTGAIAFYGLVNFPAANYSPADVITGHRRCTVSEANIAAGGATVQSAVGTVINFDNNYDSLDSGVRVELEDYGAVWVQLINTSGDAIDPSTAADYTIILNFEI